MPVQNRKEFQKLIDKYLNGNATPEEQEALDRYYLLFSEEPENTRHLAPDQLAQLEQRMESGLFERIRKPAQVKRLWPRIAAVASILLFFSIGGYYILHKQPVQQVAQVHDIAPGQNKATLTLANGQKIVLTKGLTGKLANQGNTTIQVNNGNNITYVSNNQTPTEAVLYNTLTTVRGEQSPYPLVLADGTKAWLNAASSITFPTTFNGKDRTVKITGEVYFEVAHNEKQPFKVEAKGQMIEDVGTAFNVNAYIDEPETRTTLISGIVKVNGHTLKPGQAATGEKAIITEADTDGAIAWKNNYFKFDHEDLGNTMREVSRWYNVEIVYPSGKPVTENYYGTVSRFSNLSKVVSKLEFIGAAKFKLEGNKVIVTQK